MPHQKYFPYFDPCMNFSEKELKFFRYVTLCTSTKKAFTPVNSAKLCDTSCWLKFQSQNQDHQWKFHEFSLNIPWTELTPSIFAHVLSLISLKIYVLSTPSLNRV